MTARLTELVYPAALNTGGEFRRRGLRERVLTLPVMVALVLALIWRQLRGVAELARLVPQERVFGGPPWRVSSQALEQRLRGLPAELVGQVFERVLPRLQAAGPPRQRPGATTSAWARAPGRRGRVCDASTLEAWRRQVGVWQGRTAPPLAGRMTTLLALTARRPGRVWLDPDPKAPEHRHWPDLLAAVPPGARLLLALGYPPFGRFAQLTAARVSWITRAQQNLAYAVERGLVNSATRRERLVAIGQGEARQTARLREIYFQGVWYRSLTPELDGRGLPAASAGAVYRPRGSIEDAFWRVQRRRGRAYCGGGAQNTGQVQRGATWLL